MKNIGSFLIAGAVAGIAVWFFNTEKGRRFLDTTMKDLSSDLAGQLKSRLQKVKTTASGIADEGIDYIDEVNAAVQEA